ncbi:major facilitator superfamily domain-containing protein [Schizophyllum commune]
MNASENTPLLTEASPPREVGVSTSLIAVDPYARFNERRKFMLVILVGWYSLMSMIVSGSFIPAIPQIAKDLDTGITPVSFAISVTLLSESFGSLVASSYSTFYGRRPVYLAAIPILCVGSLGVASSATINQLLVWRSVQALGMSPGFSVGAGVVGDLYSAEHRGLAMGLFLGIALLGPLLAPVVGGYVAHYWSWRNMQFCLAGASGLTLLLFLLGFPETSHLGSTGACKARQAAESKGYKSPNFVFINVLRPLGLLRSPNVLIIVPLLVPINSTIGSRYGLNAFLVGLCMLPSGLGNIIGAPLAGWLSDKALTQGHGERLCPEDRLRAALLGAGILVPLSALSAGLIVHLVPGPLGLAMNLICFFMNGIGAAAHFIVFVSDVVTRTRWNSR